MYVYFFSTIFNIIRCRHRYDFLDPSLIRPNKFIRHLLKGSK